MLNENTVLILTALARSRGDQYDTYSDNLVMYQNLARALGKTRIRKCVYFSSVSVYGEQETNRSDLPDISGQLIKPHSFSHTHLG